MLNNRNFLRVISLLIAVCLWMYVMGEVDPETKMKMNNIEVTYINTDDLSEVGLAVVQEEAISINAVIRGKRSDVNELKHKGLQATVDVSKCKEGTTACEIDLLLPSGISQEVISRDHVTVTVEERVAEEIPVEVKVSKDIDSGENTPRIVGTSRDTIMVYGAKSIVKQVECVQGFIDRARIQEDKQAFEVTLRPVNSEGEPLYGLDLEPDSVRAEAQLLKIKDVPIDLTVTNIPDGKELAASPDPKEVTVIGTAEALQNLNSLKGTVDAANVSTKATLEVNIDLPEGIYLYDREDTVTAAVILKAKKEA